MSLFASMTRRGWSILAFLLLAFVMSFRLQAEDRVTLTITLTADAAAYAPGGTVKFKAYVTRAGKALTRADKRELKIKDPSGRDLLEASFRNLGYGNYSYDYKLSSAAPEGRYSARARFTDGNGSAGSASITFPVARTVPPSDTTAPVVSVTPPAGTYPAAIQVALASNEPGSIYYTTNGSTPTTGSSRYTAPIAVASTTTLKYFAVDAAGNASAVATAAYTIATAPTKVHDPLNTTVTWTGYGTCSGCHAKQANDVYQSVHYQWKGQAAHMTTGPAVQGKLVAQDGSSAINAYCINVLGNWSSCSSCHTGTGAVPVATASPTAAQLASVDCLSCHKDLTLATPYARVRNPVTGLFEPKAGVDMNQVLRTAVRPTRSNCLECHAKAGGGDAVKRGDLAFASGTTADRAYDVHMAKGGGDLSCQACHTATDHRMPGHGSDLRASDSATQLSCSTTACHASKTSITSGHASPEISRHVGRVACQTCHIDTYAKNASDTAATEATEIHRDWRVSEWNAALNRYEPTPTKANNLTPKYAFWNGKAWGNNLNDIAVLDASTGAYKISRPVGSISDPAGTKLFPFKYKTSDQPLDTANGKLIGLSTATYFATGNYQQAVQDGLLNQGLAGDPWTTVKADEYQVLNHQVAPAAGNALACADCHKSTSRMNLPAMGYAPKAATSALCSQCHEQKSSSDWKWIHSYHVTSKKYDCTWCHTFSRKAERGLR